MDYFKKVGFPTKLSGIVLEQSEQLDGKFSMFVKDSKMKVIGCGVYEPSFVEEKYDDNLDGLKIRRKIWDCEGFNKFYDNNCLFILLADEHYYLLDMYSKSPKQIKERNIEVLYDEINNLIKHSDEVELKEQINKTTDLAIKIDEYKNNLHEKDLLIETLNQKIRILESYKNDANRFRDEILTLEKKIKSEYKRNIITIEELKSVYNEFQVERLTRRPFLFGNDEELSIKTVNGGSTFKSNLVEICIIKNRMSNELRIRVEYEHYKYIDDKDMQSGYYPDALLYNLMEKISYFLINEKGEEQKYFQKSNADDEYALILFKTKQ
jgi:hypothetical protein